MGSRVPMTGRTRFAAIIGQTEAATAWAMARLKIPPVGGKQRSDRRRHLIRGRGCTALVWAAATALAKLSAEPMRATSVAAVASVAGNTLT